jgi:hypothetical protein
LDRKEKLIDDQLQLEYANKKFMIDVRSVFPDVQAVRKTKGKANEKDRDKVFVTETLAERKSISSVDKSQKDQATERYTMEDSPTKIMKNMNTQKFHGILNQLQDKNLFIISLVNEEQQRLDRQHEAAKKEVEYAKDKIDKVNVNIRDYKAKFDEKKHKNRALLETFGSISKTSQRKEDKKAAKGRGGANSALGSQSAS